MTESSNCNCKIGRSQERFGLDDLNESLVKRFNDGASLRDLSEYINLWILRTAIERCDEDLIEGNSALFDALDGDEIVEAVYAALAGEEVTAERRARVRTRLEQAGIDVDQVELNWVTHPTVRAHLRECLGIDTGSSPTISTDDGLDTVNWAIAKCTAIIEQTIQRLHSAGRLSIIDPEIDVSARVTCVECGSTFSPNELVASRGCDCSEDQ